MTDENLTAANIWANYCDTMKATGETILASAEQLDSVNQAEGLRYLTRLQRGSYEKFIEFSDPIDPHMFRMCDERTGYGGDNPDNIYTASPIQPGETYEIRGNRGSVWLFNFNMFKFGSDSQYVLMAQLAESDLVCDEDGNFTVVLGGPKQTHNWLPIPEGANQIMLRQTFKDRSVEKAIDPKIRITSKGSCLEPLSLESMTQKLQAAQAFFCGTGLLFHQWSQDFSKLENILPMTDPGFIANGGGDPRAYFFISTFKLKPGEALLVHMTEYPEDKLWNLALCNYWLESLDYTNFRIHTNSDICHKNKDGSITLVIANEDPGVPNWLNATGHVEGKIFMRAWFDGLPPPLPMTEVVNINCTSLATRFQRWDR